MGKVSFEKDEVRLRGMNGAKGQMGEPGRVSCGN